jgi:hypothetical protein
MTRTYQTTRLIANALTFLGYACLYLHNLKDPMTYLYSILSVSAFYIIILCLMQRETNQRESRERLGK